MKTTTELKSAINDSISENRIVTVEHDGDFDSALEILADIFDGDTDYAKENDGTYDVWGWTEETPENEQDWRLRIVCSMKLKT